MISTVEDNRTLSTMITLKNIDLSIRKGEFVCVIGDVGSGKSSLLSALIGDLLYLDEGFVERYSDFPLTEEMVN